MLVYLVIALVAAAIFSRSAAGFFIEYEWWKEVGHADVWWEQLLFMTLPVPLTALVLFAIFWMVHARALKTAGGRLREMPGYRHVSTLIIGLLSFVLASALVRTRTIMQFVGGRQAQPGEWHDPAFGQPLHFYFFELPFIQMALGVAFALVIGIAVAYLVASRTGIIQQQLQHARDGEMSLADLRLGELLDAGFLRFSIPCLFLFRAVMIYFDRYELVYSDHGLLVGVDWVDEKVRLPLMYLSMAACVFAAALFYARQRLIAIGAMIAAQIALVVIPPIVYAAYVKPTEISIQKPYITRHIDATRSAYGIKDRVKEVEYSTKGTPTLASTQTKTLLENVRLWDWQAFHDTITQIQALRPYYVFADTDVDRRRSALRGARGGGRSGRPFVPAASGD